MAFYRTNGGAAALAYVESALMGKPYIFGGNYPPLGSAPGTDCSGLFQLAYYHVGIVLPRISEEQCFVAEIPLGSERLIGDGIFFTGSPSDPPPGHVGIYVGVGFYSNEQHTFTPDPKGMASIFNAPFTDDLGGIRYDYIENLGSPTNHTRPADLLPAPPPPAPPAQRFVKGMTWSPNVPVTAGDWLVYEDKKAGMPDPAALASAKSHGVTEKKMTAAELKALKTVAWGKL